MSYLVFDIETTGLPPKDAHWKTDYIKFPYIVQIAWKRSDRFVNHFIIKPESYEIPEESTKIHGITDKQARDKGEYFNIIISKFIKNCYLADKIIGHNIYFDTSIIKANILRYSKINNMADMSNYINMVLHKSKRIDTMMSTIKFCGIKQKNGKGLKYPSLEELYYKLFGGTFDAHNAVNDVIATEKCYNKLVKMGII